MTTTDEINWNAKRVSHAPRGATKPAATIRFTCRVCGLTGMGTVDMPARVCEACRGDLDGNYTRATNAQQAASERGHAATGAWLDYVAALPDDLAERWRTAALGRDAAQTALRRLAEKGTRNLSEAEALNQERALRSDVTTWEQRFEKAAQNEANPLRPVVLAERAYLREMAQVREEMQRWDLARQEIEVLRGDLPF